MAFITNKDLSVINIRLTTKGREQLSRGKLKFSKFVVGDSEINYSILKKSNEYFGEERNIKILKPKDLNPEISSIIPNVPDNDGFNTIHAVPSYRTVVNNEREPVGCFTIEEEDVLVSNNIFPIYHQIVSVSGNQITLDSNEITNQDSYILVKESENDLINNNTGILSPHLFYKIEDINGNVLTVDREVPAVFSGWYVVNFNLPDEGYPSDYVFPNDEMVLAFNNFSCETQRFPYWKLSIIFTKNILGVDSFPDNPDGTNKSFLEFNTTDMAGFVNYIQNNNIKYDSIGVIHYTNPSPANVYGEGFYKDTITLHLPTVIWEKKSTPTMGLKLGCFGEEKRLIDGDNSLNITYYDLADEDENIVGKVFIGLKLIIIEDQELLFAMSYKSNRSWTLPDYNAQIS